jgi:hypothetical protein
MTAPAHTLCAWCRPLEPGAPPAACETCGPPHETNDPAPPAPPKVQIGPTDI